MPKEKHYKEDEIDFKMIWFSIIESKRFIIIVTLAFTIASAIFVYFKPPIPTYVSSATIEIGSYKKESVRCEHSEYLLRYPNTFSGCHITDKDIYTHIQNAQPLIKLLQSTFSRDSVLSISYSSPSANKILIDVYSINQNTENILLEIETFIKKKHQSTIDKIKESRIRNLKLHDNKYKHELSLLNNKIIGLEALKNTLIKKLNLLNNRINSINSSLSEAEKKIDESEIILTEYHLKNIEIELLNLVQAKTKDHHLQALEAIRSDHRKLVNENFYKNSEIAGDIVTGLYITVKEQKNQIILRGFFIGLILSLLVILFRSRNKFL